MKVIVQRAWREPSVCVGLLTSIVLLVLALLTDTSWDTTAVVAIVAPFASSLGIRQLVTPAKAGR